MNQNFQLANLERKGSEATLWLNRPPLNILNIPMMGEIVRLIDHVRSDPEIRILLLRGQGRCFSAGMDVGDHLPDQVHSMFEIMHQLLRSIDELEIPTISIVHGSVLGGGLELAIMTDLTYAISGSKLGQPEINLGVFPPLAAVYFPELIGFKAANDLVLSGRSITAEEAQRMGLINDVLSAEESESEIQAITSTLLAHSKASLAITKRAIRYARRHLFDHLRHAEKIYLEELMRTEDAVEGLQAFIQKRKPEWRHR